MTWKVNTRIRRIEHEREIQKQRKKPWVAHHVKAMSLRGIFLREGRLASLSTGGARRPVAGSLVGSKGFCKEQPVEREHRDPACAGK